MSLIIYDLSFLVLFVLVVGIFLYIKRKNLKREGIMYLYKTKLGLEFINYMGKKFPKTLRVLSYIIVGLGYVLMVSSIYLLFEILFMFTKPEVVKMVKVPPIMPLIPYMGEIFKATWLPPFYFTYWIIAIALVAIFHEGFHGIFARFNNIRIKSTGFGFLGPFLAFFVEQDDKQMQKAKIFPQLTVLAAGVFANVLLTIIFFLLLGGFFSAAYAPTGVIFADYSYIPLPTSMMGNIVLLNESISINGNNLTKVGLNNQSYFLPTIIFDQNFTKDNQTLIKFYQDQPALRNGVQGYISQINNIQIRSNSDISKAVNGAKPGDKIKIITHLGNQTFEYNFNLGNDYNNNSRAVIGIAIYPPQTSTNGIKAWISTMVNRFNDPSIHYDSKINSEFAMFIYYLLWWIFMINLSVAIANMLPLGIFDGGRFFYLTVLGITKNETFAEKTFKYLTWFLLAVLVLMMILYFIGIF